MIPGGNFFQVFEIFPASFALVGSLKNPSTYPLNSMKEFHASNRMQLNILNPRGNTLWDGANDWCHQMCKDMKRCEDRNEERTLMPSKQNSEFAPEHMLKPTRKPDRVSPIIMDCISGLCCFMEPSMGRPCNKKQQKP